MRALRGWSAVSWGAGILLTTASRVSSMPMPCCTTQTYMLGLTPLPIAGMPVQGYGHGCKMQGNAPAKQNDLCLCRHSFLAVLLLIHCNSSFELFAMPIAVIWGCSVTCKEGGEWHNKTKLRYTSFVSSSMVCRTGCIAANRILILLMTCLLIAQSEA